MKNRFLEVAKKAAHEAAVIHKRLFNSEGLVVEAKSAHYDRVTEADVEAEKTIVAVIRNEFPDHNILGEEEKYERTGSEYEWVIDPLDGTNNFSHGLPIFSVSIALARKGEVIIGVVYDPIRDELFHAEKGTGAFLNGRRISVAPNKDLQSSILITGFYYSRDARMVQTLEDIKLFFLKGVVGIRRFGSAALDLCYVASGRAGGFWEFQLYPWDFAAGMLIVEEAGGRVTGKKGEKVIIEPCYVVSSNGIIHEDMLEILNRSG